MNRTMSPSFFRMCPSSRSFEVAFEVPSSFASNKHVTGLFSLSQCLKGERNCAMCRAVTKIRAASATSLLSWTGTSIAVLGLEGFKQLEVKKSHSNSSNRQRKRCRAPPIKATSTSSNPREPKSHGYIESYMSKIRHNNKGK